MHGWAQARSIQESCRKGTQFSWDRSGVKSSGLWVSRFQTFTPSQWASGRQPAWQQENECLRLIWMASGTHVVLNFEKEHLNVKCPSSWHKLKPTDMKGINYHCHEILLNIVATAERATNAWSVAPSLPPLVWSYSSHWNLSLDPHDLPRHVPEAELENLPQAPKYIPYWWQICWLGWCFLSNYQGQIPHCRFF